ncbi:hypothetical protein V8J82_01080 [Gymnodinialimonas sp. 2305UL16-5]|uniref:head-tail connector protein n=1 Tax=Gymnodinialimonas mytili TaxID=3126503 RepID=UPI0030B174EC
MIMVELTPVPSAVLPVSDLADHLRLASGFADDGSQNARLEQCLRAAMAAIEARIGKALFQRRFALTLTHGWKALSGHGLPVAPVASIDGVRLIDGRGAETVLDPSSYGLRRDTHRPQIIATAAALPSPVQGGSIEIEVTAGFSADWIGIPADLREAMLSLASEYYDQDQGGSSMIPSHIAALIAPHRQMRLGGQVV